MQQICVTLNVRDIVSKLKWQWKLQNFTRYSGKNVNKFLIGVSLNAIYSVFWIYI